MRVPGHNEQCTCVECSVPNQTILPIEPDVETSASDYIRDQGIVEVIGEPGSPQALRPISGFPPPSMLDAVAMVTAPGAPDLNPREQQIVARRIASVHERAGTRGFWTLPAEVQGAEVIGAIELELPNGGQIIALHVVRWSPAVDDRGEYAVWWDRETKQMISRPLAAAT